MIYLNDGWSFYREGKKSEAVEVRLPHTNVELPFNYLDEKAYQFVSVYEKSFDLSEEYADKLVFLCFEGAAHKARVYINGEEVCIHDCGYTAFSVEISKFVVFGAGKGKKAGTLNKIIVVLDSQESLNVPPFGHVIDYLTYGGIYREVYLDIREKTYISDVFVRTTSLTGKTSSLMFDITVEGDASQKRIRYSELSFEITINDSNNSVQEQFGGKITGERTSVSCSSSSLPIWSIDEPNMCRAIVTLRRDNETIDEKHVPFGIRTAKFERDGFYLNGKRIKLHGLNRHQSYPYVGYAMPKSMQEYDAEVLKNKLGVNAVRTSHYPQSKYFLDACDRLGLIVFTEAPGWQYVGDDEWREQHLKNVADMVLQNRNHPSIVLWGVRVNESQDFKDLYTKANRIAHELDDSRQTSGVRFLQMSQLLEDVYAFNDFSHTGDNRGLTAKAKVTPKAWKPYLVSEYNGHMFPTKPYDDERHRLSHALRHASVLSSLYDPDNGVSGCFGWCMFDYNTHKDFGSGDKICYHGVLDMFRNPKLAASVYASQQDEFDVCEVSSSMDIGEHPAGCLKEVFVFTNADFVDLYKNGEFVRRFTPDVNDYPNMPHPPVKINDFIGCLLEEKEGLSHESSEGIKKAVNGYMTAGYAGVLKPGNIIGLGKAMISEKLTMQKGLDLFYKYVGNWGSDVTVYRFDAIKGGKVVKSVTKAPVTDVKLVAEASATELYESSTYDVACVNLMAVSQDGNLLNYLNEAVTLKATGTVELIGPSVTTLRGGLGGTYVKTTGKTGRGKLTITGERFGKQTIDFTVKSLND